MSADLPLLRRERPVLNEVKARAAKPYSAWNAFQRPARQHPVLLAPDFTETALWSPAFEGEDVS